jgi:two-component system, OmpR family, response regulator
LILLIWSNGKSKTPLTTDAADARPFKPMNILLIEDDAEIAGYLAKGLRAEGHVVDTAQAGVDGLHMATTGNHDVLVIDRMLPGLDGLAILRTLRASGKTAPALFLTALGRVDQKLEGFAAGGDDYLVKPFAFSEFLARLQALARRPPLAAISAKLSCGGLDMDRLTRRVTSHGQTIDLQAREFALLEELLLHKDQVLTRTMLLERVWDMHFDPRTNIVDTHVSRLRAKLGKAKDALQTVRGAGYVLRDLAR